ncbi:MAG TPA: type IV pilus assembly protein PilM [Pseudobdellovibrionaceae bacterium]|nr:type IV pilus assembly protein PilM [Pseudobdellovibrionaceae bacterium]
MFFKSKKVIGLDIGTSSIKMAELNVSGSSVELVSFVFSQTPPQSVSGGELLDTAALSTVIEGMASELKSKSKLVAMSMWGTSVIVKKITIPKMEKKVLKDQIKFEAEQYLPFDLNNIRLVYQILKNSDSPDTMDVILVAAQNELVNQYTRLVSSAGLTCSILDVSGFALANLFELNYGKSSNEVIALFNFGASTTNLSIVHSGEVIFARDIPVGGQTYTNEIHKSMGITIQEAEALKMSASKRGEVPDEVHSIINATNDLVTEEIKSSLDFFIASNNGTKISKCFYTGGSAATNGLISNISKNAGLSLDPINPFKKIKINTSKFSSDYIEKISPFSAIVLGLALRKVGDHD